MFHKPPLSPVLVETLFARLIVTWGRDFTGQYEGVDDAALQADWADKLRGYQLERDLEDPDDEPRAPAIMWALDNLPEKPLNAIGFRALCGRYTAPGGPKALPAPPRALPPHVAKEFAELAKPLDDKRPERVRVAARYIRIHGDNPKSTPLVLANLADAQRILVAYEEQLARDKEREAAHAAG